MKKLSFVLAMIIALSGVIGLFSAPAYAADDVAFDYEYVVGEGGYATIADAAADVKKNEAAKSGTHGIKVTGDVTESASVTFAADVTIYSDNKTAPNVTVTIDSSDKWITIKGALTVKNLNINVTTAHDVVFINNKIDDNADITFDGCNVKTLGRFIRANADAAVSFKDSKMEWNIIDTTVDAAKVGIQYNNRSGKDAATGEQNDYLKLVIDGSSITSSINASNSGTMLINTTVVDLIINDSKITNTANDDKNPSAIFFNSANQKTINVTINNSELSTKKCYAIGNPAGDVTMNITNSKLSSAANNAVNCGNKKAQTVTINVADSEISTTAANHAFYIRYAIKSSVANLMGDNVFTSNGQVIAGDMDLNIYGGTYTSATTNVGQGVIQNYDDVAGDAKVNSTNIYGGTFIADGKGSCIVAGASSKSANINIYGGTFIDNGETLETLKDEVAGDESKIPTSNGALIAHQQKLPADGGLDKNYKIYGGTFMTKAEAEPFMFLYENADEMFADLAERGVVPSVEAAKATYEKNARMLGKLNSVADDIDVDWFEAEGYAWACTINPVLDGVDLGSDLFKVKGVQILKGTTPNSPSTVARVLFMVKADAITGYDNLAAWFSTDNATCLKLDGEIPAGLLSEYGHSGAFVNETERTNKVYSSVLAGDVKVAADAGYYFVPVTVNVSNDNFDTDIYLRLFAREDGGEGIAISDVVTLNIAKLFN